MAVVCRCRAFEGICSGPRNLCTLCYASAIRLTASFVSRCVFSAAWLAARGGGVLSSYYLRSVRGLVMGVFAVAMLATTAIRAAEPIPRPLPDVQNPRSGGAEKSVRPSVRAYAGSGRGESSGGVIVTALYVGGPTERAGLQVGDQIITLNGQEVASDAQLLALLDRQRPNDLVVLLVAPRIVDESLHGGPWR